MQGWYHGYTDAKKTNDSLRLYSRTQVWGGVTLSMYILKWHRDTWAPAAYDEAMIGWWYGWILFWGSDEIESAKYYKVKTNKSKTSVIFQILYNVPNHFSCFHFFIFPHFFWYFVFDLHCLIAFVFSLVLLYDGWGDLLLHYGMQRQIHVLKHQLFIQPYWRNCMWFVILTL